MKFTRPGRPLIDSAIHKLKLNRYLLLFLLCFPPVSIGALEHTELKSQNKSFMERLHMIIVSANINEIRC
jgi:hypothetical protein